MFSTKNREPLISSDISENLYGYIGGVLKGEQCHLLGIGGMADHIHIACRIKPSFPLSEIVKKMKANSSRWMNERKESVGQFFWQGGYGAFSVSESQIPRVLNYIGNQREHHRTFSFQEEYTNLLNKHQLDYNETHLWN